MRVVIFDLFGNILQKFNCSKHLEFPNGVVVNDEEEIFISDNRAHCVKVFNYQGMCVDMHTNLFLMVERGQFLVLSTLFIYFKYLTIIDFALYVLRVE